MLGRVLDSTASRALEKALDTASLRHQVIAHNLANVNTPGFKRFRVDFGAELRQALASDGFEPLPLAATRPGHVGFSGGTARPANDRVTGSTVVREDSTTMRNDGNNVDLEAEMSLMTENSLWYSALARQLAGKFSTLKYVISEGRR